MGLKKTKPIYAVAKIDSTGWTLLRMIPLSTTKRKTIDKACWELGPRKGQWKYLYRQGYRIITVTAHLHSLKGA